MKRYLYQTTVNCQIDSWKKCFDSSDLVGCGYLDFESVWFYLFWIVDRIMEVHTFSGKNMTGSN